MNIIIMISVIIVTLFMNIIIDCFLLKESENIIGCIKKIKNNKKYMGSIILIVIIEGALLYLLSWGAEFLMYYMIIFALYKIAVIDIREKVVEPKLFYLLLFSCLLSILWNSKIMIINSIITAIISFTILYLVSKLTRGGFGMGDAKVIGALGFLLGYEGLIGVLLIASISVSIFSAGLLIKSRKNREIPFIPFILFAILLLIFINN